MLQNKNCKIGSKELSGKPYFAKAWEGEENQDIFNISTGLSFLTSFFVPWMSLLPFYLDVELWDEVVDDEGGAQLGVVDGLLQREPRGVEGYQAIANRPILKKCVIIFPGDYHKMKENKRQILKEIFLWTMTCIMRFWYLKKFFFFL